MTARIELRQPGRTLAAAIVLSIMLVGWLFTPTWWGQMGVDSKDFYAAARVSARGGDPYDARTLYAEENRLYNQPNRPPDYAPNTYPYPPLVTLALRAGTAVAEPEFYIVSAVLLLAAALAGLELLTRSLAIRPRPLAWLLLLASPVLGLSIFIGNPSNLLLLGWAAALALMLRQRWVLAGAAASVTLLKLQIGLPMIVALLATVPPGPAETWLATRARALGGLMVATAGWAGLQLLAGGPGGVGEWLAGLSSYRGGLDVGSGRTAFSQAGLAGLPALFLGRWSVPAAVVAGGVPVVVVVAWALWPQLRRRHVELPPALLISLGLAAALAACPYLHLYDLSLEILPVLVLAASGSIVARSAVVAWFAVVPLNLIGQVLLTVAFGYRPDQQASAGIGIVLTAVVLVAIGWECRRSEVLSLVRADRGARERRQ